MDFFDMYFYKYPQSSSTEYFNILIASDLLMSLIIQRQGMPLTSDNSNITKIKTTLLNYDNHYKCNREI